MKTTNVSAGIVLFLTIALIANTSTAQMRSGKLGVGVEGSLFLFNPNIKDNLLKGGGGVVLSYSLMEHLGLRASFGTGQLGWKDVAGASYTTTLLSGDVKASFDILPHSSVNPFLCVGAGALYFDPRADLGGTYLGTNISKLDIVYMGGAGLDIFFSEFLSMTISGDLIMTNTNKLDMMKSGTANESYSRANLEFRYYFFDQNYITKLLKALQERYEKK
jgi:hypothetical protein